MSIDRITHLIEQMHRSEDDLGDPITDDYLLAADGLRGLKWVDPASVIGSGLDIGIALFLDHGNAGSTETIDQSTHPIHWITLDTNCTLTFSGAVATVDGDPVECGFRLYVETPGAFTITWPGSVTWEGGSAPDVSAAGVYILDFTTPDGGTNWYGRAGGGGGTADLSDDDPLSVAEVADPGVSTEASRADHVHPMDLRWEAVTDGEDVFVWESDDLVHEFEEY